MTANVYSVEDLLRGHYYRSRSTEGEILSAEKREDVWYENAYAYVVRVRPTNSYSDVYRTVAVATQD